MRFVLSLTTTKSWLLKPQSMKKRIAILFHKNEKNPRPWYLISYFADIWREDGNEVIFLFGIKKIGAC
jgi:hypothetical protein